MASVAAGNADGHSRSRTSPCPARQPLSLEVPSRVVSTGARRRPLTRALRVSQSLLLQFGAVFSDVLAFRTRRPGTVGGIGLRGASVPPPVGVDVIIDTVPESDVRGRTAPFQRRVTMRTTLGGVTAHPVLRVMMACSLSQISVGATS